MASNLVAFLREQRSNLAYLLCEASEGSSHFISEGGDSIVLFRNRIEGLSNFLYI
jgi:hypothetical protein